MNVAALFYLVFLRVRGGFFRRLQGVASPRGIAFLLLTALVLTLLFGPIQQLTAHLQSADDAEGAAEGSQVSEYLPLVMLLGTVLTILTTSGPPIHFSPAERAFLLTGPFTREVLVLYKILMYSVGAAISATIIVAMMQIPLEECASPLLGSFFALVSFQLFGAIVHGTLQLARHRINAETLRFARLFAPATAIVILWYFAYHATTDHFYAAVAFFNEPACRIVFFPFHVFALLITSPPFSMRMFLATAGAAGISTLAAKVIVRIDRALYLRGIDDSSTWHDERESNAVSILSNMPTKACGTYPFLITAWRQLLNARRTSAKVVLAMSVLAFAGGPILFRLLSSFSYLFHLGVIAVFAVFIFPKTMSFDFRADIDQIRIYKRLPLSPIAIVAGQLAVPVLLTTVLEVIFITGAAPLVGGFRARMMYECAFFLLPFNALLYAIENLLILLFPTQLLPVGRVDFEFFGRNILDLMVKGVLLTASVIVALNFGVTAHHLLGFDHTQRLIVVWFVFAAEALFAIVCLARVFAKSEVETLPR